MSNPGAVPLGVIPLSVLSLSQKRQIREVRNHPDIRKWMFSKHEISASEHEGWLWRVESDSYLSFFAVTDLNGDVKGGVSYSREYSDPGVASWAFYLAPDIRGGAGAALEYHFLNYIFDQCNIDCLHCEVLNGNDRVVKLHKKFGFLEEDTNDNFSSLESADSLIHRLHIPRSVWTDNREVVYKKISSVLSKFSVNIYD